jgi:F-type H+-transporting ATPase subunit epsilon
VPLEVHLVTPERELWSGAVEMLIARGVEGEVGILGGHAPLLIRLAIGPLKLVPETGEPQIAVVDGGFLHVTTREGVTRVDVLADHAELADEIDTEAARRRVAELEARSGEDDDRVRAELAKATARVNLGSS